MRTYFFIKLFLFTVMFPLFSVTVLLRENSMKFYDKQIMFYENFRKFIFCEITEEIKKNNNRIILRGEFRKHAI